MKLSTKIGLGFALVGFLLGFFDRQIFGQSRNSARLAIILGLGLLCFATMFVLSRRDRGK
ncbi:MAG TPA: hypothetical protein VM818_13975 [Vicinamibacterales bacterium]|jgi:hypothetical protein|nr:hypothetical protein [Vicinamibacterales bacterium]